MEVDYFKYEEVSTKKNSDSKHYISKSLIFLGNNGFFGVKNN